MSDSTYSHEQIKLLINDLVSAVVKLEIRETETLRSKRKPDGTIVGHFIDHIVCANVRRPNPLQPGGEGRELWAVRIGIVLAHLLRDDLHLRYDPAPITRLQHGISQAVARHVLTHSKTRQPRGGWKLDTLIHAVSGELDCRELAKARYRIKQDIDGMAAAGIIIDENWRVQLRIAAGQPAERDREAGTDTQPQPA